MPDDENNSAGYTACCAHWSNGHNIWYIRRKSLLPIVFRTLPTRSLPHFSFHVVFKELEQKMSAISCPGEGRRALLAHAPSARFPIIPLAGALHLLVQPGVAQKLFDFRPGLARSRTVGTFGQSPHQDGGKGGIIPGLQRIYSIINIGFSMIIRQVRSPFLPGDQVGNAREEEIEVIGAIDGLQGIVLRCQSRDGGESLVDGPAKVRRGHSDRNPWCVRSPCQT